MPIDRDADRAAYRQLADALREHILSGAYRPGDKLPSESRLAREHGVGRETVRQALAVLRGEGLTTSARGIGTLVRDMTSHDVVPLAPGDRISARMPIEAERRAHQLPEGTPILELRRATGAIEIHPADRVKLTAGPGSERAQ